MKNILAALGAMMSLGHSPVNIAGITAAPLPGTGPRKKFSKRYRNREYRGCKRDFSHMTRQRRRAEARKRITAEVRAAFQLPRRVLRAIVRTRVNREWRAA